ncbi:MAG TPA: hypothetical protein DIW27_02990 [Cytophagales bacterium]|nr:hypothetical protein [Cytophagales bacterium]
MIRLFTLINFLLISFCLSAQQSEKVAIMVPINNLFEGMNKGDSALVHKAFRDDVTFATVSVDKEGNPKLTFGDLQKFLVAMGTPRQQVYSEPIWDVKIEVDGNLAQVWAKYAFYLDKNFHHCGVDAFQLFKGPDGWKIFQLTDTRQQEGCNIPKAIQDRFK